ncbi:ATP-binding protein [Actinoplanes sp. NPDC023714]|uniref:ATP-binding protein n=1 Tax=Actinoplanes sp. NPDC023714 TaxID=3154322 RepID=UPI003410C5F9
MEEASLGAVMTGPAAMEMTAGGMTHSAADRLAALTVHGARAACGIIHLAEGGHLRLVGGYNLPEGFQPMQSVPVSATLGGLVLRTGFPVVISDVNVDERVPADAPVRAVGIRSFAGFPVRDPDGTIMGTCSVMDYQPRNWQPEELTAVDDGAQACTAFVAELRAHEVEYRQRMFLDTLLDSLDTGVAACDTAGRLVLVNRSLRERLGVSVTSGLAVEDWARQLPLTTADGAPIDPATLPLLQALGGTDVRGAEYVLHGRDGRRQLVVNAHPIRRMGAVGVFHDVTEARRAAQLTGELARSKDEYLNLVGHELRTPVTIIGSYLELLNESDPATAAADLLPMIAAARRGSERLRRLVEALLDLSAFDAGKSPLQMADLDLAAVVSSAVADCEPQATAKHLALTFTEPARLPLHGDARRLNQLVTVLVDNAITYTPDGGAVTVTVTAGDTTAAIDVTDTGLGIPAHERPMVFDRFFRGAITTELAIPGAGLGLALAKLITERHHGTIAVTPNHRRPGTTVHVELPR